MAENSLKPRFWQGNKLKFSNLASSLLLERGKIYFVGDSVSPKANGLDTSTTGVINIATSSSSYVTFGAFDISEIEKRITEIEQRLEEYGGNIDELIKEVVTLDEEVVTLGGKVSEIGSKVSTMEDGAEKNVQSDWNETDETEDSYIIDKPSALSTIEILEILV